MQAREELQRDGRWSALRADLAKVLERHNSSGDRTLIFAGEYLTAVAES